MAELLGNCARMTREFYPVISVSCLQVHHHVMVFLPLESRLSQVYGPKQQPMIEVKEGREQMWNSCVRILEGHTDRCSCIAFSADGGRLVSGSDDRTAR